MQKHLRHFGIQLYRLRKRAAWSQRQLAERLKVAQPYIAALESGRGDKEPSLSFLMSVSSLFDVGVDQLLGIEPGATVPTDAIADLSDTDRTLIEQLSTRLAQFAQIERMERFNLLSDSVRALGDRAVDDVERITNVELAPSIKRRKVGTHATQEELFHLA